MAGSREVVYTEGSFTPCAIVMTSGERASVITCTGGGNLKRHCPITLFHARLPRGNTFTNDQICFAAGDNLVDINPIPDQSGDDQQRKLPSEYRVVCPMPTERVEMVLDREIPDVAIQAIVPGELRLVRSGDLR